MDRRKFIQTGLGAAGSLMLPWERAFSQANEVVYAGKPKVWITEGDPVKSARTLVDAIGGMEKYIPADGVVLLKPNIVFATPREWGGTTDPDFLAAMIDLCIEAGAGEVIVADHMVGDDPNNNLKVTGIGAVCEGKDKVRMVDLQSESAYKPVKVEKGADLKETKVTKILDEVDLFINLPTAKHGVGTIASMGLKNMMGLIWDRNTFHNDLDLHQAIADLNTVIRADITFLDARWVMQSGGPKGPGEVDEMNKYLMGFDPLALDAAGVIATARSSNPNKPLDIPHLTKAYEHGIGEIKEYELIEVG